MADYSGQTVAEILKLKKARIKNAPLAKGSPSWDEILDWNGRRLKNEKGVGNLVSKPFISYCNRRSTIKNEKPIQ
jgi:hypothetical protein